MHSELSLKEIKKEWHGSVRSYMIGFVVSLILTTISFLLVITQSLIGTNLILSVAGLGLAQAVCQLLLFLHLGQEAKPRWETVVFYFMLLILLIIVLGTLWIMFDLYSRMMMPMTKGMMHD